MWVLLPPCWTHVVCGPAHFTWISMSDMWWDAGCQDWLNKRCLQTRRHMRRCDDGRMKSTGVFRGERRSWKPNRACVHHRPVVGLWWSDVGGGAQLAPGPLVVGAAASSVAVRFLTERIWHGVGPKHATDSAHAPSGQITVETGELNSHSTPIIN